LCHAAPEFLPLPRRREPWTLRQRFGDQRDGVAGCLREHHDRAAERLQQVHMVPHSRDLVLCGAFEQTRAVPAGDEGKLVALEYPFQLACLARKLAAELDADITGLARLCEADLERNVIAEPAHVIVGPADRIDAEADHDPLLYPMRLAGIRPRHTEIVQH